VNDHDCSLQAQQLECLLPETRFESVRWWVANMISRSETYLLGGRRILVVGAGKERGGFRKGVIVTSFSIS
jgi:hypothetical protein